MSYPKSHYPSRLDYSAITIEDKVRMPKDFKYKLVKLTLRSEFWIF